MIIKKQTPIKAIRAKCLECSGNKPSVVRLCESDDCSLHFYRFGRNPSRKGCGPGFHGQPPAKVSDTTQVFKGNSTPETWGKAEPVASNLEAFNTGIKIEPIEVETKGRITIHRMDKVTIIKLTEL